MQGADQHIKSSLGFSIIPKDASTCRPGKSNQQPSNNKTPEPQPSHGCFSSIGWISSITKSIHACVFYKLTPQLDMQSPACDCSFITQTSREHAVYFISYKSQWNSIKNALLTNTTFYTLNMKPLLVQLQVHQQFPENKKVAVSFWRSSTMD